MKMVRSVTALAIATAMLATSITPAMARDYSGYGRGYSHGQYRHHNRGVSAGDVVAGVAVVGILAAIVSAASKTKRNGGINSEDKAADACAVSAEQRFGNGARVDGIDQVYRTRDGYQVSGTIDTRSYRSNGTQRFSCTVRYGAVEDVQIDDGYAYRGY